jgi:peptidoglycan/LPS O-acetylase OafA/YrhL
MGASPLPRRSAESTSSEARRDGQTAPPAGGDIGVSGLAGSRGAVTSFLSRLGRVTSSGRFIPEIDGLRFVAIFAVFLYHLSGYVQAKATRPFSNDPERTVLGDVLVHGNLGVQLFFVISGFILALPFASQYLRGTNKVSLRSYFMRRLTRLEPPYIVSMVLFFVLLVGYVGRPASELVPHLLASLAYLHNLVFGVGSAINGVAWSLEVEVQFYVLVPLLAHVFAIPDVRARRAAILAGMAGVIAFQWLFIDPAVDSRLSLSILNHLQFFLIGFLLADVFLTEWNSAPRRSGRWDVVSLLGWPAIALAWDAGAWFRLLFPALLFVLYCAAFRGRISSRIFGNVWLTTIGGMCYSIYLLHYQIISFVGRHAQGLRVSDRFELELLWQLALIAPAVLLISAVFFALIEKPCMRRDWPQRLMQRVKRWRKGPRRESDVAELTDRSASPTSPV